MLTKPALIFTSGVAATGKTTIMKGLAKVVDNSFFLDRDDINSGNLYVSLNPTNELPPFEEYVQKDTVFPDNAKRIETIFGLMLKIDPRNAFYRRHVRDQSYIIQANIAKTNLGLGKLVIMDGVTIRQIVDGTLGRLMRQESFDSYPKCLIHFYADESICRQRIIERAKGDAYAATRVEFLRAQSEETFHKFVTEEQPMLPPELENYQHLKINTSEASGEACVNTCLDYIGRISQ